MLALKHENDRLKREMAAFDVDFFAELEDLKWRYARLQEVMGDDPYAPASLRPSLTLPLHTRAGAAGGFGSGGPALRPRQTRSPERPTPGRPEDIMVATDGKTFMPMTFSDGGGTVASRNSSAVRRSLSPERSSLDPERSSHGQMPLDRLGWAARNAVTAMDRAGLMSPLANERPRQPHPFTYAPAGYAPATTVRDDLLRISGEEYVGKAGRGPAERPGANRAAHSHSHGHSRGPSAPRPLDGAFPGWDINLSSAQGSGGGESSLAGLCERRLYFELSNHARPEEAVRVVSHRLRDLAARQPLPPFYQPPTRKEEPRDFFGNVLGKDSRDSKDKDRDGDRDGRERERERERERGRDGERDDRSQRDFRDQDRARDRDGYGYGNVDRRDEPVLPPADHLTAGHVSCAQLREALGTAGLHFSAEEVQLLAAGFGSDGRGGIRASEFCDTLQVGQKGPM